MPKRKRAELEADLADAHDRNARLVRERNVLRERIAHLEAQAARKSPTLSSRLQTWLDDPTKAVGL